MTTAPFTRILNPDKAKSDARQFIDLAEPLLEEVVNYSTRACGRCVSTNDNSYTDLPAFVLYLHIIEMTDGVRVLISQSCCEPAALLIRSSFEAFLSISYLLKDNYQNRSLSWLYFDNTGKIRKYQQLDPESTQGKNLAGALRREGSNANLPRLSNEQLAYIRQLSGKQVFKPIEIEHERTKKERKIKPQWYTLFDGPQETQGLAKTLGMEHIYIALYREWSEAVHARNSSRYIYTMSDGTIVGHQLRFSYHLLMYSFYAGYFLWATTDLMMNKFRPFEPNHAHWMEDIRNRLAELPGVDVKVLQTI